MISTGSDRSTFPWIVRTLSVMQASCGENVSDDSAQMSESSQSDFNNHFTQFCADNLDHNIQTLDGNNTFHCMGMIAADVVDHDTQSLHAGGRIQRLTSVEFYLYPTVGTVLIHSVKPELTE